MNTEETDMTAASIREAADRYGMTTAALRHYDDIGLVVPAGRRHGERVYGREQLRRLALVALCRRLGLGLDVAVALLDGDRDTRRSTGSAHLQDLRALIARAQAAMWFLDVAASCSHVRPAHDCPDLMDALDRLADGAGIEAVAAQHGGTAPPPDRRRGRRVASGGMPLAADR